MDDLKIDSHKLIYHIDRVKEWLDNGDAYPIYIEMAPAGGCNHRCIFCGLDYMGYKPLFLKTEVLKKFIKEAGENGLKSMMYAGEGEPLLHKDIADIVHYTKDCGIDVAVTTNGVFFTPALAKECLAYLCWIKISLDAGRRETYAKIHRAREDDFDVAINNIKEAVKIKIKNSFQCTIGAQILLLPETYNEADILAKTLKDIGADYLIIKPYSKHPLSENALKIKFSDSDLGTLEERLQKFTDDKFTVVVRKHTMQKLSEGRPYRRCLGLPFWTYISAGGDMYACSNFLGDKRFCFGNIYKNSFEEIWHGEGRKKIMDMINNRMDARECREVCRLDEINIYLWNLKHPSAHVNFI